MKLHINGYFALDQNRRHLKLASAEQVEVKDDQILWNQELINDLIPECLINLLNFFRDEVVTSRIVSPQKASLLSLFSFLHRLKLHFLQIFEAFPNAKALKGIWKNVHRPFYRSFEAESVLCTLKNEFTTLDQAFFLKPNHSPEENKVIKRIFDAAKKKLVQV